MAELEPFNSAVIHATAYEALINRVNSLKSTLAEHSIRLSPSSRLINYARALDDFRSVANRQAPANSLDQKLIHQAAYEIEQIEAIVTELSRPPETPNWKAGVQALLSGSNLPESEKSETKARDRQFEFYIAALCKRSGLAVQLAEPDIIVKHPVMEFCIAAKRIKSPNKLQRRIREAIKQIALAAVDGVICLDLTPAYNPSNAFLIVEEPQQAIDETQRIADSFIRQNIEKIQGLVDDRKVFGIMVFINGLFYVPTRPQLGSAARWSATNLCDASDQRYGFFRSFVADFAKAVLAA